MIHNREYISYYSASTALYNRITTILAYIADVPHQFSEWEVDTVLESDMGHAYVTPSNKGMTATDTQKNTVYYVAKQMKSYCTPEEFAIALARHFVQQYPLVFRAKVTVKLAPWSRYSGQHHHGFIQSGSEIRSARVIVSKGGIIESVVAGVTGLKVLKTTQSGYEGFLHDEYTLLPDTRERILATSMSSTWKYCSKKTDFETAEYDVMYKHVLDACLDRFFGPMSTGVYSPSVQYTLHEMGTKVIETVPLVSSIHFSLPNLHFIPCAPVNSPGGFEDDVYVGTQEPHGTIEAVITRGRDFTPHCKL